MSPPVPSIEGTLPSTAIQPFRSLRRRSLNVQEDDVLMQLDLLGDSDDGSGTAERSRSPIRFRPCGRWDVGWSELHSTRLPSPLPVPHQRPPPATSECFRWRRTLRRDVPAACEWAKADDDAPLTHLARSCSSSAKVALPPVAKPPSNEPERGHLFTFWWFLGQAILGRHAEDAICREFELGGTIDCLGDVAFVRDEIVAPFLEEQNDMLSVVWHILLVAWLGAGGPNQETYKWLRDQQLARRYLDTDLELVSQLYKSVERRAEEIGAGNVFHGDSRAVKWRLCEQQQGEAVLAAWYKSVPRITSALNSETTPEHFEQVLRQVRHVGELTAKELFVLLHYARPRVADTRLHVPVGPGARAGAQVVLQSFSGCSGSVPNGVAAVVAGEAFPAVGAMLPNEVSTPSAPMDGARVVSRRSSAVRPRKRPQCTVKEGNDAVHTIAQTRDWALRHVPGLAAACERYKQVAAHRDDPARNCRVARDHLLDLADVEVMLCYYHNYNKMKVRIGVSSSVASAAAPRGWMRRAPTV
eukprot:TRINITY_DN10545_c0_g2_i1.p1 TRINITY_DN10545_c0_g2~~TRINITY_DN10545_c0_g2_i1.p1  ORF type:complete len:527 (-),score=86.31 TRINITY_DN10545_c0_g2_i1:214-1794(-)